MQAGSTAGTSLLQAAGHSMGGYSVEVLPESYLGAEAQGKFRLIVEPHGKETTVRVLGEGLSNLRAFYAQLYCPPGVAVSTAQAGTGFGPASDVISLCHTDAGVVHFGTVLKRFQEREGISGAAELARIVLRPGAGSAARETSSIPKRTAEHSRLWINCTTQRIEWDTRLTGDYNQDGIVNLGDLTPLAAHWGESGLVYPDDMSRFVMDSIQEVVDGNNSEQIGLDDLTPIGMAFGEHIAGWNVYSSQNPAQDFPDVDLDDPAGDGGVPSKIIPLAYYEYEALALGNPAQERLRFSLDLPQLTDGLAYWVRPVEADVEGTPSNWSPYDAELTQDITARIDPETYYGMSAGTLTFELSTSGASQIEGVIWGHDVDVLRIFSASVRFDGAAFDYLPFPEGVAMHDLSGTTIMLPYLFEIPDEALASISENYDETGPGLTGTFRAWTTQFARTAQTGEYLPHAAGFAPARGSRKHDLSFDAPGSLLTWYYAGLGDKNQNGIDSTGDLVMVNYYWGSVGPFALSSMLYMVDSYQDGVINVTDITPTGVNYLLATTGYNVYASLDPAVAPVDAYVPGDPGLAPLGYVSLADALGDRATDRLHFSFNIPAPAPGTYLWVQPEYRGEIGGVMQGDYVQVP